VDLVEHEGVPMVLGLRELEPHDRAFVASTWGRTCRARMGVSKAVFVREHPAFVDTCLGHGRTLVLCSATVPSTIFGWSCGEQSRLHYAYVVPELQHRGLGRVLIGAALGAYPVCIETTHRWPWPSARFVFNPFRLMRSA